MQNYKIKSIDINAFEWFDRINGNSYFAGYIILNYGLSNEITLTMPFQYGYGSQYRHEALTVLQKEGYLPNTPYLYLHRYCKDNNIILRDNIKTGCLKRELLAITK